MLGGAAGGFGSAAGFNAAALAACIARAAADAPLRDAAALSNRCTVELHANWQHTVQRMRSIYERAMRTGAMP